MEQSNIFKLHKILCIWVVAAYTGFATLTLAMRGNFLKILFVEGTTGLDVMTQPLNYMVTLIGLFLVFMAIFTGEKIRAVTLDASGQDMKILFQHCKVQLFIWSSWTIFHISYITYVAHVFVVLEALLIVGTLGGTTYILRQKVN